MELNGPYGLGGAGKGCVGNIGRRANHLEILRDSRDGVTMTHPHLRMLLKALEERIGGVDRLEISAAILTAIGLLNLTAKGVGDELSTIADTQYWDAAYKLLQVDLKGFGIVNRIRRAAQDDANHRRVVLGELIVRQNLAEGIQFTHTTAYQLCGL